MSEIKSKKIGRISKFLKFMNKMTNESVLSYYTFNKNKYWRNINIIVRSLCAGDFRYLICYSFISAHVIHRKWHSKIKKPNQNNFYRSKQYNSIIGKYYIHKRVFFSFKKPNVVSWEFWRDNESPALFIVIQRCRGLFDIQSRRIKARL